MRSFPPEKSQMFLRRAWNTNKCPSFHWTGTSREKSLRISTTQIIWLPSQCPGEETANQNLLMCIKKGLIYYSGTIMAISFWWKHSKIRWIFPVKCFHRGKFNSLHAFPFARLAGSVYYLNNKEPNWIVNLCSRALSRL